MLVYKKPTEGTPRKFIVVADSSKCTYCQICEYHCSLRKTGTINLSKAAVQVYRLPDGDMHIEFTDDCDLCGLCVRYCPYGAISQEKVKG